MTIAELRKKISENRTSKYQKFILAFDLLKIAAEESFQQAYGSTANFSFEVDSSAEVIGPMTDTRGMYNSSAFNQIISSQNRSKSIKYKFSVDNGKASDMNFRSTRGDFINKIILNLSKYRSLLTLLSIKYTDIRFVVGQGGKNPTLEFSIHNAKRVPDKKTGKYKRIKIPLIFKMSLKAKKEDANNDKNPLKTLKPIDIRPQVVAIKLTPEQFKTRILKYVSENMEASEYVKQLFAETVELSDNDNLFVKSNMSSELSSEIFEVLSALKLAKLVKGKNKQFLQNVLWFDDEMIKSINPSKVKIKIPRAANEPLMDYEIFYADNLSIKVSVKSKLSSNPATVKFSTVFDDPQEVERWYNTTSKVVSSVRGSKIIAKTALEYNAKGGGKETLYPVTALYNLLNDSKFSSKTWADTKSKLKMTERMTKDNFKNILKKIDKNIGNASVRFVPIDSAFSLTEEEIKYAKLFIAYNISDKANVVRKYTDFAVRNVISKAILQITKKGKTLIKGYDVAEDHDLTEKRYPFSLNNFGYLCEKAVVQTSKKNSSSRINFWKLFYDNVLAKKQILYSVMYEHSNSGNLQLEYKFVSDRNFAKYKKWVELRSKNNAFNLQDTLGMNV